MTLIALPLELIESVMKQLDSRTDLIHFSATCKRACSVCRPRIFACLRIQVGKEGWNDSSASLFKSLTRGKIDVARLVRNLSILTVFPLRTRCSGSADMMYHKTTQARALGKFVKDIRNVIPQFVGLRHLHCDLDPSCGFKAADIDTIIRALAVLPRLVSLSLNFGYGSFLLVPPYLIRSSLSHFKNLRSVEIRGEANSYGNIIGPLVANNPKLTRLAIVGRGPALITTFCEIRDYYNLRCLPITELAIGCSINATVASLVPYLRHLRIRTTIDSFIPSDFWIALTQRGIPLVTLLVHNATDALMQYIESYSGLEVLSLSPADDRHAEAFYTRVLQRHICTLRKLSIEITSRGKWCAGPCALDALSRCTKLVELNMPIYMHHEAGVVYNPRRFAMDLQQFLVLLPSLQQLYMRGPTPIHEFTGMCIQSAINYFHSDDPLDLVVSTNAWVYRFKTECGVYVLRCVRPWKAVQSPWDSW
ncbi:hypothetical protein IW261DRAFT_151024 [Armillaria novae-zelandiae]|uniref:F-box domain-containing protein n=1 Tax=Armillaria novae-zelandiae TaxID=153914 RepID=A0AA39P935_9AGAR|nr:hypothetical protein IW261DRAFT_151024 [Armillaria novae-zelandiae]